MRIGLIGLPARPWRLAIHVAIWACLIDEAMAVDCTVGTNSFKESTKAVYEERYIECRAGQWQYPIVSGDSTEWRPMPVPLLVARFRLFGSPPPAGTPPPKPIPLEPAQGNAVIISPALPLPHPAAPASASNPISGQTRDSQFPPNTFEGAQNLGSLDRPQRRA